MGESESQHNDDGNGGNMTLSNDKENGDNKSKQSDNCSSLHISKLINSESQKDNAGGVAARDNDNKEEDKDKEPSQSNYNSSYISDPVDSDNDSNAAYHRYLDRKRERDQAKAIAREEELDQQKEGKVQKAYSTLAAATKAGKQISTDPSHR